MRTNDILYYINLIPVILVSLVFHEFSHAFVSYKLGDPTAKNLGRLTLNPLKHLDPLGTLMIVISTISRGLGFGWAKPVPINPGYYRNPKAGSMIVSLAGPLANVILAIIFSIPLFYYTEIGIPAGLSKTVENFHTALFQLSYLGFYINLGLAVFNIIPVPPLDGSKILSGILPARYYFKMMEYENYVGIVFLVLIFAVPGVLSTILGPVIDALANIIRAIVVPILRLF